MEFIIRKSLTSDKKWLYDLYRTTLRDYIDKTWGWDEVFHKNQFETNLLPTKFKIIMVNNEDVGAYLLKDESEYHWLEMFFIHPKMQRAGLGSGIISCLQADSLKAGKPLRLSVLKVNPAKEFYSRHNFKVYDEDEASYKMQWVHHALTQLN